MDRQKDELLSFTEKLCKLLHENAAIPAHVTLSFLEQIEAPSTVIDLHRIATNLTDIIPLLPGINPQQNRQEEVENSLAICQGIIKFATTRPYRSPKYSLDGDILYDYKTEFPLYCALWLTPSAKNPAQQEKKPYAIAIFRYLQAIILSASISFRHAGEYKIKKNGFMSTRRSCSATLRNHMTVTDCLVLHEYLIDKDLKLENLFASFQEEQGEHSLTKNLTQTLTAFKNAHKKSLKFSQDRAKADNSNSPLKDWHKAVTPASDPDKESPQAAQLRILDFDQGPKEKDSKRNSAIHGNIKPTIVQDTKPVDMAKGESPAARYFQQKIKSRYIATNNQLLHLHWDNLSFHEIYHLLITAAHSLAKGKFNETKLSVSQQKELAALIATMFYLSKPFAIASQVQLTQYRSTNDPFRKNSLLQLYYVDKEWGLPAQRPHKARKAQEDEIPFLRPTATNIILPVYHRAWDILEPWIQERREQEGSLNVSLFVDGPKIDKQDTPLEGRLKKLLKSLNKKSNCRFTVHRISSYFKQYLAEHCDDHATASTCLGELPTSGQQTPLYYYASDLASLQIEYIGACTELVESLYRSYHDGMYCWPADFQPMATYNNIHIGTAVCPTDDSVTTLVKNLRARVRYEERDLHRITSFIDFHNAMTSYCMAFLAFASGYRAVKDPLFSLNDLDMDSGLLAICDKDNIGNYNARLVWIPLLCRKQIAAYDKHRRQAMDNFIFLNPALHKELQADYDETFIWPGKTSAIAEKHKHPFLFYLKIDLKKDELRLVKEYSVISGSDYAWQLSLPTNANRHYLRSKLNELGVSGEIIDAYMGHWLIGQEPFGRFSTLSPHMLANELEAPLTKILADNCWQVIGS